MGTTPATQADWRRAVEALAGGASITAAARASGLRRETVSRRLRRDPAFRSQVQALRDAGPAASLQARARETLDATLSGKAPPATAARTALAILAAGSAGGFAAPPPPAVSTPPSLTGGEALDRLGRALAAVTSAVRHGRLSAPPEALTRFRATAAQAAALGDKPEPLDPGAAVPPAAAPAPSVPPGRPALRILPVFTPGVGIVGHVEVPEVP